MKKLLILIFSVALFTSCSKDKPANRPQEVRVFVRIQNEAGFVLENAIVGTTAYGNVTTGAITDYKALTVLIYAEYCRFVNNGNGMYAGHLMWCGTPPLPPSFEAGYYTFTIEPAAGGHNEITVTKL